MIGTHLAINGAYVIKVNSTNWRHKLAADEIVVLLLENWTFDPRAHSTLLSHCVSANS